MTDTKITRPNIPQQHFFPQEKYEPGDMVATYYFLGSMPGQFMRGYVLESPEKSYHGGTIYVDVASGAFLCKISSHWELLRWCWRGIDLRNGI